MQARRKMEYPITVKKIEFEGEGGFVKPLFKTCEPGAWVAVRPRDDECKDKTFLGVYLGDLAVSGTGASFDPTTGTLTFKPGYGNPAMWVPDLNRVVMGYESWWGVIESPDGMRQITNKDIDNVWYVKALKAMTEKEPPKA